MQDKTKEIKELTIKGLEPEIHKLLAVCLLAPPLHIESSFNSNSQFIEAKARKQSN